MSQFVVARVLTFIDILILWLLLLFSYFIFEVISFYSWCHVLRRFFLLSFVFSSLFPLLFIPPPICLLVCLNVCLLAHRFVIVVDDSVVNVLVIIVLVIGLCERRGPSPAGFPITCTMNIR